VANPRHPLRSPLTIADVVLTGLTGTIERMPRWQPSEDQAARAAELIDLLGVGPPANDSWTTFSQGERGRALIAREQLLETLDHVHTTHPHLASVLVTHHLEELPASTTHAALLREGKVLASGPAYDVLTTNLISKTFNHPIRIQYAAGRWTATARPSCSCCPLT